jgi:hypothetical protein
MPIILQRLPGRCVSTFSALARIVALCLSLTGTLLTMGCHNTSIRPAIHSVHGEVSVTPPDRVPLGLASSGNIVTNLSRYSIPFIRDIVLVLFKPGATSEQRTDALRSVHGTVVGGIRFSPTDGYYVVALPRDSTNNGPLDAVTSLSRNPSVRDAMVDFIISVAPNLHASAGPM